MHFERIYYQLYFIKETECDSFKMCNSKISNIVFLQTGLQLPDDKKS